MAEEAIRDRRRDLFETAKTLADFFLVPTSFIRTVRDEYKEESSITRGGAYFLAGFAEALRLGLYYQRIAEPLYNTIVKL